MFRLKKIKILLLAIVMLFIVGVSATVSVSAEDGESVTVYISISDDGDFVKSPVNGTPIAYLPVKIDYFDLKDYGLEKFYRLHNKPFEEGGEYIKDSPLIKRPTLLHLYIKMLEQYYKGSKLTKEDVHSEIIDVTQTACHMYMKHFWGHDENLMYFVNHKYPLMAKGIGSTADYILLEDGDEIDLAMFSDWEFYHHGAFLNFDKTTHTTYVGEDFRLKLSKIGTQENINGGQNEALPVVGEKVRISNDQGRSWKPQNIKTDENGYVTLYFSEPGTYYVSAGPGFPTFLNQANNNPFVAAPPISVITVKDTFKPEEGRLKAAKKDAKRELSGYVDFSMYTDENKDKINDILAGAYAKIDSAGNVGTVRNLVEEAKREIDEVEKVEKPPEDQKLLDEAKKKALEALAAYDPDKYSGQKKEKLKAAIEKWKTAINGCETLENVRKVKGAAIKELEEIIKKNEEPPVVEPEDPPAPPPIGEPDNPLISPKGDTNPPSGNSNKGFPGNRPSGDYKKSERETPDTLKKLKIDKVKGIRTNRKNGKIYVKWRKTNNADGYVIAFKEKTKKKWKYKTCRKTYVSVKKLKLKRRTGYRIRVRAYKRISGKKKYGAWSGVIRCRAY